MTPRVTRKLRRLEQRLARRPLSAKERLHLQPVIGALRVRVVRELHRAAI